MFQNTTSKGDLKYGQNFSVHLSILGPHSSLGKIGKSWGQETSKLHVKSKWTVTCYEWLWVTSNQTFGSGLSIVVFWFLQRVVMTFKTKILEMASPIVVLRHLSDDRSKTPCRGGIEVALILTDMHIQTRYQISFFSGVDQTSHRITRKEGNLRGQFNLTAGTC